MGKYPVEAPELVRSAACHFVITLTLLCGSSPLPLLEVEVGGSRNRGVGGGGGMEIDQGLGSLQVHKHIQ